MIGKLYLSIFLKKDEKGNAQSSYRKQADKEEFFVRKDGFKLIANSSGKILTDEKLLKHLYDFRFIRRFLVIITNIALVGMATYKPQNRKQFIELKGVALKVYENVARNLLTKQKNT